MVLPVLILYGQDLEGASPQLLGLALGIYGLTQAVLQIPAGTLSDRFGRKPVIIVGLIIFAVGSAIAASADTVYELIIGRALQGSGAIASAIMALVTDLTREENRMKAMASIGASIGLAFSLALVLGPLLAQTGGLALIFWVTTVLALLGVLVTLYLIPTPPTLPHRDSQALWPEIKAQLSNKHLWPLNIGIFALHAIMVAIFVAIPAQLELAGLVADRHSWFYLPVLLVSFVLMVPCIIVAEKKQQMKRIVQLGTLLIVLALLLMGFSHQLWHWVLTVGLYFWGFNLLEASLPSWLSKVAPAGSKGSAMGIYSSLQFFGAFVGGAIAGAILQGFDSAMLFVILGGIMVAWLLLISRSKAPEHLTSVRLAVAPAVGDAEVTELMSLQGVSEVRCVKHEHAIYLKVNADQFDRQQALTIIGSTGE